MKVALVYDRVNKWGGAERVLLALHKIFPDAPLFTSVHLPENAEWAKDFKIKTSFLQRFPFAKNNHEALAPLMPMAFESFDFSEYELVISVTSEAAKGIRVSPHTKHICICLTPTRYLYSGFHEYFTGGWFEKIASPFIWYLKKWDKAASSRPDIYVSISKTVKNRIKNIYGRDAQLIYPPISKDFFSTAKDPTPKIEDRRSKTLHPAPYTGPYFLVVSRLVTYKRIDLAIKAANALRAPLLIIGKGRRKKNLEKIAGETITWIDSVSDTDLRKYYKNAKALIFPGNEDLGLTMIEAQACGTPVIAYRKGGATELVKEGRTGEFFEDQTVESLTGAMEKFDSDKYNSKNCIQNAKRFDFEKFRDKLLELI